MRGKLAHAKQGQRLVLMRGSAQKRAERSPYVSRNNRLRLVYRTLGLSGEKRATFEGRGTMQAKGPKTLHQLFLEHELRKAGSNSKQQAFIIFTYYEALLCAVQQHQWCDTCSDRIPKDPINQQAQILLAQLVMYKKDRTISPGRWNIFFQSCRDLFSDHLPCQRCQEQLQQEILQTFHAIEKTPKKRGE
jgi:hypothetical protein